jgi:SAM-dependent methyltransferase
MLETTRATAFIPATNLRGGVAGANWLFLLPSLELHLVVCLGAPPATTLVPVSRFSQDVAVISTNARQLHRVGEVNRRHGLTNIHRIVADRHTALPFAERSTDLVVITGHSEAKWLNRGGARLAELQRLLKPEGLIYFEFGGLSNPLLRSPRLWGGEGGVDHSVTPQLFWLTPLMGETETAVPMHDRATIRYFFRRGLYSPLAYQGAIWRIERFLSQHPLFSLLIRRHGALVGGGADNFADQPPQYLRLIAQEAGVDISQHRWGLAARGKYNSRKVQFILFDRASESPEYIVKMTRDSSLNVRLENQYRALTLLRAKGIGDRETLPQAVFFGYHANLAIQGETVIDGAPFLRQTRATADCPYAQAAINWLIRLGAATADPAAATPSQAAEVLHALFEQFVQIYQPAPAYRDFLADQIAAVERGREAFPVVFQHGDPGIWNALVTPGGQAAFLDWEAAEPRGMPLWDLFYFLRSYSVRVARTQGTRDGLEGFAKQFLAESPLSPLVVESVERYCRQIGLPARLVEPLFHTCWMHRALKEATRLTSSRLERGHYVSLLRLCIDQREAPTLRRLFSLSGLEASRPSSP